MNLRNILGITANDWLVLFALSIGGVVGLVASSANNVAAKTHSNVIDQSSRSLSQNDSVQLNDWNSIRNNVAIHALEIATDTYELPNSGVNNDVTPGNFVGSYGTNIGSGCQSPLPIVQNATLAKGNPNLQDFDWYNFSVIANVAYTLSVDITSGQSPIQQLVFTMQIYDAAGSLINNSQTGSSIVFPFLATANGTYRIYLAAQNFPNNNPQDQTYQINLCSSPTNITATPQTTLTPTPVPTALGAGPDPFEPNDSFQETVSRPGGAISFINVGSQIANANFYPYGGRSPITVTGASGDIDWYFFYGKKYLALGGTGGCYQIRTTIQFGVDTDISIYSDPPTNPLAHNDDVAPLNRSSQINLALTDNGRYWVKVLNLDSSPRGAGQTYSISVAEYLPTGAGCAVLYTPRAYLPIQIAMSAISGPMTATPVAAPSNTPFPTFTSTASPNQLGPVIVAGTVAITNVNAAAGTAFDEYLDLYNTGTAPVTLVDWKIRVSGQVYNLSNPPGTQIQMLQQQGCRVYTGTNVGPVALPGEYNACGPKFLGITSGTKIYPNTTGYRIELLNESNVVVAYYGR